MTLRVSSPLNRFLAALLLALLPFAVFGGEALAQVSTQDNTTGGESRPIIGSITNTASAQWNFNGRSVTAASNQVRFDVTLPPPEIRAFRGTALGSTQLVFREPFCSAQGRAGASSSAAQTSNLAANARSLDVMVERSTTLRAGQDLMFEIQALAANTNPNAIDQLEVVITTSTGDRETEIIFETGENTGIFIGQMATVRMPPPVLADDCSLSLDDGATITIAADIEGPLPSTISTQIDVLVDPFGLVFDSETGEPINGARVTLIDDATGLPATVFAEDGVTAWPSSVISGDPVTDGAGNVITMRAGEFWFPLVALGRYRLEVEAPQPYSAPSVVQPAQLAGLTHPDGRAFVINEGSYGGAFTLVDPTPVQIDIPVDRAGPGLTVDKTVSRAQVVPGDVVFYAITVANADAGRAKRDVVITDTPSRWLRLRPDTIRINGEEAAAGAVTITPDGSALTVALDTLAAGASARITYAMSVRPDAAPGRALNNAVVSDLLGRTARAQVPIDIQRDTIADRLTIIGRITAGSCEIDDPRPGIPGVRIMLEDGSFAVSDADGRYHFEGVVPGTHVVAVSRMTLPDGATLVDCHRSTRNTGSASSRFVIGQGGTLVVADFHAAVPEGALAPAAETAETRPDGATARAIEDLATVSEFGGENAPNRAINLWASAAAIAATTAPKAVQDWLSLGDGPDGWLSPSVDANPRAPAVKVAIRHRKGQSIALRVDGEAVNPLTFDGVQESAGRYAVSVWRGVPLETDRTLLEADIINSFGVKNRMITREVFFTKAPAKVELIPELSNLVADGRTRPVIAVRVLDRTNRPLREGIAGEFTLNAPYESAEQLDRQQLNQLTGLGASGARWVTQGEQGVALIELAPTMVSGSLRLGFTFNDGEIVRQQDVEAWIEPGDIEWTIVGLAEGTLGAKSVADNMERAGAFDSDLGEDARVALYAKGRVLGKYLVTLAYDSAKQREDQRVLGALDPNAYYTVFADGSLRRFDAASREKLYVRIETSTFFALYGDFQTAFDQTRLARYNRTATGVRAEARLGQVKATGFAAKIGSRLRREEIQGQGVTGPYALGSPRILPNSEQVTLEVRDRFRPEIIVSQRTLTRFIDFDLDPLSGTLTFKQPVLSRDEQLNPQFIIVEYETDGLGDAKLNAGVRADWTNTNGKVRIGASAITDADTAQGNAERTNIAAIDLRAQLGQTTEVRAELGVSERSGKAAKGFIVEAQKQTETLDILAYARQIDGDYGIGQQNLAEQGRRKIGLDGRVLISDTLSVLGSVWQDDSLTDTARRRAAQAQLTLQRQNTLLRLSIAHFNDRLSDGTVADSTVLEAGATQRLFDGALEVTGSTSIALDKAESVDLPARHRFDARYEVVPGVRLVGSYEIADGENFNARQLRGGIEGSLWNGGQIITALGQETIGEFGNRSFAAFGLSQNIQVTPELTLDASVDGNRTLGGTPSNADLVNPNQPAASGGQITGNLNFEDFTAVTFGGAWRKDRWSVTARGEYRDGEEADRTGVTIGAIRQMGEGSLMGSGVTWTRAQNVNGSTTAIMDASLAFAHRPEASEIAMLGKLEYRSDQVTSAVAGNVAGAGRTALLVDGDATSRRLVASLSTNWSPRGWDEDAYGIQQQTRRDEYTLFLGARYNFDQFEGTEFSGTTALAGLDARLGVTDRFELGFSGTVRANLEDEVVSFAFGPTIGVSPAKDTLITVGYNIEGFRDGDFAAARNTTKGLFAAIRLKFDAETLGLHERQ